MLEENETNRRNGFTMSYKFITSPNNSSRKGTSIDGVILHFTAGGDINGTVKWLCHPEAKASAHYVISRSGEIIQLIKEDRAAWHAGSSTTTPKLNGRRNLNSWTIGIEICNWGWLYEPSVDEIVKINNKKIIRKSGEKYAHMKNWTIPYKGPQPKIYVVDFDKSKALQQNKNWPGGNACFWEPYTEIQINAIWQLLFEIIKRYPHITKEWIATHADVDPTRKLDMVGNIFPFKDIIESVFDKPKDITKFQIGKNDTDNVDIEDMKEVYEPREEKKSIWCFK